MSIPVRLNEPKKRAEVISALEQAARDLGWGIQRKDNFKPEYKLGSVQLVDSLDSTNIILSKGKIFGKKVEVTIPAEIFDGRTTQFFIDRAYSRKGTIEQYLSKVSEYLKREFNY